MWTVRDDLHIRLLFAVTVVVVDFTMFQLIERREKEEKKKRLTRTDVCKDIYYAKY